VGDSPYSDLTRPPLREAPLRRALVLPGEVWTDVRVVGETGSTNADVAEAARAQADEGLIVIAERQRAGRGRLDRGWVAPARSSLTFSVLLRPTVAPARLGWLPLLAGVALTEAVGRVGLVDAALKWPNDLLVRSSVTEADYGKCAGILAEAVNGATPTAVVLGIGLNVSQNADELPISPTSLPATSLLLADAATTDREPLVRAVLRALGDWYRRWSDAAGDPDAAGLAQAYRKACVTLGRQVEVSLPGGGRIAGRAESIDGDGRLVIATGDGRTAVAAGDVEHVR
jgi:BirA family biotin operon repressor/biotin-[acetyl-CoA-carboxylase] ligase